MNLKTFTSQRLAVFMVFLPLPLIAAKAGAMFLTAENQIGFSAQCLLLVAMFLGPGAALCPHIRRCLPPPPAARFICIVLTSIFTTSFAVWILYFLGVYTRTAALIFATILIGSLLVGIARFRWSATAKSVFDGFAGLSWPDKFGLALSVWFLTFSTLRSFEPFSTWDALVSWDKWGRDMGARNGLGGYVMGAYPQLIPTIYSLFYKIFATPDSTIIPDATYFAHLANGLLDWLVVPAALVLCRRLGASLLLFSAIFFGNGFLNEWFATGYVDTSTTAFFLCTAALVVDWNFDTGPCRWSSAVFRFVPAAATLCFAKGQGVLLTFFAALLIFCRPLAGNSRKAAAAIAALAAGVLIVLPYPVHQRVVWNSGRAETDIRLHTMPVRVENPAAGTPTFSRAFKFAREFAGSYKPPFVAAFPSYTFPVAIILSAGLILSLRKRRILVIAIAAALGWTAWFRLASYDWRNASQIAALTALCTAAGLRFNFKSQRLLSTAAVFECLIALALSGNALSFISDRQTLSMSSLWRFPPDERPSGLCGPRFDLLAYSPLTSKAQHVFTQNTDVWLLGGKAVYLWHPFAAGVTRETLDVAAVFRDQLGALDREFWKSFELASGFQTQVIGIVQPGYERVCATIEPEDLKKTPQPLPAVISEPGTYWIHSAIGAGAGDVALYDFEVEADDYKSVRMVVGRDWNDVTSYRGICDFVREGCSFRVLFWLDRLPAGTRLDELPPVALVKSGATPITVKSAKIKVLEASASTRGDTL